MTSDDSPQQNLLQEALKLERQAHQFLMDQKNELAFEIFKKAAVFYSESGKNDQAGHCFRNAASCWSKHIGQQPLRKAADSSEAAAREFLKAGNYDCAVAAFSDSAFFYEKDGDWEKFSLSYYESKKARLRREWDFFLYAKENWGKRLRSLARCFSNLHGRLVWGYGERPFRTFAFAFGLILVCALVYRFSGPVRTLDSGIRPVTLAESFYFSIVTFATVGYGDFLPLSLAARFFAVIEALSGIILTPLFLVALTRRYLRIS